MNEQGVSACILHFSVLNTRSSIFCMVLPSNRNFGSPTCSKTLKGTLISSNLAASDKHATANNCTAQVLPLCSSYIERNRSK
nr:hypothetical protein Iba_chr05dCG0990 [Ipomoea batatas]GME10560.1 hypothetical protein Iba_scaffold10236CG0050 [Ipomoea batatas]